MKPTVSPTAAKAYDCDAVVVGAGVVGLATARALLAAQPGLRVRVLEREERVAAHQSGIAEVEPAARGVAALHVPETGVVDFAAVAGALADDVLAAGGDVTCGHEVRALIYPVPDPRLPFLGVHLTRGLDGAVHVGPTALPVAARDAYRLARVVPADLAATLRWPGTWRMARRWWRTGATAALALGRLIAERAIERLTRAGA